MVKEGSKAVTSKRKTKTVESKGGIDDENLDQQVEEMGSLLDTFASDDEGPSHGASPAAKAVGGEAGTEGKNEGKVEDPTPSDVERENEKERNKQDREKSLKSVSGRIHVFLKGVGKVIDDVQKKKGMAEAAKTTVPKMPPNTPQKITGLPKAFIIQYRALFTGGLKALREHRTNLEGLKGTHLTIRALNQAGGKAIGLAEDPMLAAKANMKSWEKQSAT